MLDAIHRFKGQKLCIFVQKSYVLVANKLLGSFQLVSCTLSHDLRYYRQLTIGFFFFHLHRNSTQHMVQLGTALWEQALVHMLHIQQEGSCTSRLTRYTSFSSRLPFSLWDIDSCGNLIFCFACFRNHKQNVKLLMEL